MPVTKIVQHLKKSLDGVSDQIKLGGGIQIYNHYINTLSDRNAEVAERLWEQQVGRPPTLPQPDTICISTKIEGINEPTMVVEYKSPHNLTLTQLRLVLGSDRPRLDLDSIINNRVQEESSPKKDKIADSKINAGRLVAVVMTQAFHHIVECGTQYGYITTGEAYVFLYIKPVDHAKTVYYHLAEPKEDVNAQ